MKLYQFWASAERSIKDANGHPMLLKKWGGSNTSAGEAEQSARNKLDELATRLMTKAGLPYKNGYLYTNRDMPEELIERIDAHSGVTRNRYGCLVLNSDNMMIADIDLPTPNFFGKLMRWLGNKKLMTEHEALLRLTEWLLRHPDMGARVYRTAAGLRYLFTHAPIEPSEKVYTWLSELGSDKLYTLLCKEQKSFRARLTPKPWRCGHARPPMGFYPFTDDQSANRFASWFTEYEVKAAPFATCQFVATYGRSVVYADLQPQIDRHDDLTRCQQSLPLA